MRTFRRLIAAAVGAVVGGLAVAVEIKLPPITGELSGDFKPFENEATPKLHWFSNLRESDDASGGRTVGINIDGDGTRVRGIAKLTTTEEGSWEITEGALDLGIWFPAIAEKVGGAMKGLAALGAVEVKGKGLIRTNRPEGVVQVTVRGGRLGNIDSGWSLEGVRLTADFLLEGEGVKVKSTTPFELVVGTITTRRFGAQNLLIRGVLNEDRTIALNEAQIEIAGGEVKIDPAMLMLSPLGLEAALHISNVGLQDIAALIPQSFASAEGRIDGVVRLGWSLGGGFRVGRGNLALGPTERAIVRLAPAPRFLTQSMPKRFEPVPSWMGPLSKWLSADNPVYTDMAEIELGRAPLQLESLVVRLTPEGDEEGRTATVRMTARPTKPDASVKVVHIDVNVAGSLDSILKLGLNRELSIQAPLTKLSLPQGVPR